MPKSLLYLDHAAATPVDPQVLAVMQPYFAGEFYNPSAMYGAARAVRATINTARAAVASCLGARPAEIIFTAGGSEANNLAIHGVMRRYPGYRMLVSAIEHDSVLATAGAYAWNLIPVNEYGILDVSVLPDLIDDETILVSTMYANNEIGTIQPIRTIAEVIARVRRDRLKRGIELPLYLHVDAAQAANYLDMQVSRLGVDLLSINGGKIYGPKQSGALYVKAGLSLAPLVSGGGQEQGLRSGTENVPGIVGFAHALKLAQSQRHEESRRLLALQRHFFSLLPENLPSAVINGSQKHRLPNNLHITLPGADNERLIFALDEAGIMAAAGSACSASNGTPSHVLQACGLSDEAARSSLRFTMGRSTNDADIDRLLAELSHIM